MTDAAYNCFWQCHNEIYSLSHCRLHWQLTVFLQTLWQVKVIFGMCASTLFSLEVIVISTIIFFRGWWWTFLLLLLVMMREIFIFFLFFLERCTCKGVNSENDKNDLTIVQTLLYKGKSKMKQEQIMKRNRKKQTFFYIWLHKYNY